MTPNHRAPFYVPCLIVCQVPFASSATLTITYPNADPETQPYHILPHFDDGGGGAGKANTSTGVSVRTNLGTGIDGGLVLYESLLRSAKRSATEDPEVEGEDAMGVSWRNGKRKSLRL